MHRMSVIIRLLGFSFPIFVIALSDVRVREEFEDEGLLRDKNE